MKTLLELIESWKPCGDYEDYLQSGCLTTNMTLKDILYSKRIEDYNKEWFFEKLLNKLIKSNKKIYIEIDYGFISVMPCKKDEEERRIYHYNYETFIAMIYEMLEHTYEDVAI